MGAVETEGRAAKAAQLHHLQRKIRQLKAQIKKKDAKYVGTLDKPQCIGMDDIQFMHHVNAIVEKNNEVIEGKYGEWRRQECRREGSMRKHIDEAVNSFSSCSRDCFQKSEEVGRTYFVRGGVQKSARGNRAEESRTKTRP